MRVQKRRAELYQDIYGKENYFIEIQDHGLEEQKRSNPMLIKLAGEIGAGLVATNDLHYIEKTDAPYQDVLMCIQMGKKVDDPDRMKFGSDEFYLKSGGADAGIVFLCAGGNCKHAQNCGAMQRHLRL